MSLNLSNMTVNFKYEIYIYELLCTKYHAVLSLLTSL